ncbi:MAG: DUF1116 domain-containing protein [Burkholderiales bacterium]|nr:DUF1116 domain-containing protein [Burkholderiales bacterium]
MDAANATACERIIAARPMLTDVMPRADAVWPEMKNERILLHAGAPVAWEAMCGPMHGAMIGAVLYEGWAATPDAARAMLERGEVRFAQCHDFRAVGPMTGIISASMPVFVVDNPSSGNRAYTNLNEGIGKCLRFGANSPDVLARLKWFEAVLAPTLRAAVRQVDGGIDLKSIQAQALLMGDEVHSRNAAATALFFMQVATALAASDAPQKAVRESLEFISRTSQFFLNLSMVAAKAIMDAAHGIEYSSIVTATARNGTTTALRVSSLGAQWFEAPSDNPVGLFFPGFKQEDANPDLGDSAITETAGYGGFSLAASPALTLLVGGSVADANHYSRLMYEITTTKNPALSLPNLEFDGAPTGIDVRKVVDTGIRPVVTTGIAHKEAGIGQIGAGIVRVPMQCYVRALEALAARYAPAG